MAVLYMDFSLSSTLSLEGKTCPISEPMNR